MITFDPHSCFHCGTPVSEGTDWTVQIFGQARPMCCPGCAAVAQTIVSAGMANFYLERDSYSAKAPDDVTPTERLRLFDLHNEPGTVSRNDYAVEGIHCAACIWLIERAVRSLAGVRTADLNFGTGVLHVTGDATRCKPSDILGAMQAIGFKAHLAQSTPYSQRLAIEQRRLSRRLFIAGLSMMQVMMYAIPAYLAIDGTMDNDMASLMRWAGLLLTTPAVLYSAQPFFSGAWNNLKHRVLGMDVPVALGIAAAFGASIMATWRGQDPVYFDSVTMFIFLLLASRYLELHARIRAATALDTMLRAAPASAWRLLQWPNDRSGELVNAELLRAGDFILFNAGDVLAADGVIEQGSTRIDLSVLSGESQPQHRTIGDTLPAGASNVGHPVVLRICREANVSTLALIVDAARRARLAKPGFVTWADAVAGRFVGILLVLALAAFLYWQHNDSARSWPVLIAMLVASCPCALSLAAPTVLAAANARLLGQGILTVQPHALEVLHRSTHVVFDKTGTLTVGRPVLHAIDTGPGVVPDSALAIAAALAAGSQHPLSIAICAAGKDLSSRLVPSEVENHPGRGIEAIVNGIRYRLGSASFVAPLTTDPLPFEGAAEGSEVLLGSQAGWLARFRLNDALRPESRGVINHFKACGKTIVLLSGDRQELVQRVAGELGIDRAHGDCMPDNKTEIVRSLQIDGAVVAMVGDGINDASVLNCADVSFAMGEGSTLAQASADCILLSGRLDSLCEVDRVSTKASQLMAQNLWWAACYNLMIIPAAAVGVINPWVSAIGMSASSMFVVLNSLRIYKKAGGATKPAIQAESWLLSKN